MSDKVLTAQELRIGNIIRNWKGLELTITSDDFSYIEENPDRYEGIPLTEELIIKLRVAEQEDFMPLAFTKREPGERQVEFQYWSNWINENYKLHLCPSYGCDWIEKTPIKRTIPDFWFCWYQGNTWYLSIKPIRGGNVLRYVHQLQNLYFALTGNELKVK